MLTCWGSIPPSNDMSGIKIPVDAETSTLIKGFRSSVVQCQAVLRFSENQMIGESDLMQTLTWTSPGRSVECQRSLLSSLSFPALFRPLLYVARRPLEAFCTKHATTTCQQTRRWIAQGLYSDGGRLFITFVWHCKGMSVEVRRRTKSRKGGKELIGRRAGHCDRDGRVAKKVRSVQLDFQRTCGTRRQIRRPQSGTHQCRLRGIVW
ncbi:uncharacterized protein EDB93DRAFT_1171126 [Suillus bovinus]|uniref:uncharacterized protein n=1 Tax=Suillus bovinus TaxID=48563 RepID=UPI001B884E4D|nr:uncharacterized protein EDB93DRAFT_1171126 [Suillus bovinus]KAG2135406.1 hypothetical protein EDB93DRAFT_1171126 [Suillus bovinus]